MAPLTRQRWSGHRCNLISLWDRDAAKGEGVCPPWRFRAPAGQSPARAKTPAGANETLTEVTKSHEICAETDKKSTSGQSDVIQDSPYSAHAQPTLNPYSGHLKSSSN